MGDRGKLTGSDCSVGGIRRVRLNLPCPVGDRGKLTGSDCSVGGIRRVWLNLPCPGGIEVN